MRNKVHDSQYSVLRSVMTEINKARKTLRKRSAFAVLVY